MRLTEKQIKVLEALARFKFLTSNQLQAIFSLQSSSYINTTIRNLKKWKSAMITSIDFGIAPWVGRLSKVHCLSIAGVRFLQTELSYAEQAIHYPKNRDSFFQRDYFHRVASIDFNIQFQQWLANNNYLMNFFHLYFNKSKEHNYRRSITSLSLWKQWIEPDWIGLYYAHNKRHLFLFEQHNGRDTQRAINQMVNHSFYLANGTFSDFYNLKRATKIYYVFEKNSCKKAVMQAFINHPWLIRFEQYFFFKSQKDLSLSFYENWLTPTGRNVSFTNEH